MQTITSYSSQRPLSVDEVTSPTTTYVNDQVETQNVPNQDGVIETQYVYRTRKYSKQEYAIYQTVKDWTAEQKQARINELQSYLSDTDWYASRLAETGVKIPKDIKQARADARIEISLLRDLENFEKE